MRVFCEKLLSGLSFGPGGDNEVVLEAEERLISSCVRVRVELQLAIVPVKVASDSDIRFDSNEMVFCSVLVVQSEHPDVVENDDIRLSSSSTDLAPLGCQPGLCGLGDSKHGIDEDDDSID